MPQLEIDRPETKITQFDDRARQARDEVAGATGAEVEPQPPGLPGLVDLLQTLQAFLGRAHLRPQRVRSASVGELAG